MHPVDSNLVVTASNDWTVRLNDVRMMGPAAADSKGMQTFEHILHVATSQHYKGLLFCLVSF